MPGRNLYTDAQAIATLRGLSEKLIANLPARQGSVLRNAKSSVLASERLVGRANARNAHTVTVYEPTMDELVIEGNCADMVDNPYSLRVEPVGALSTSEAMLAQAEMLRAAACAEPVKRALASLR